MQGGMLSESHNPGSKSNHKITKSTGKAPIPMTLSSAASQATISIQ